MSQSGPPTHIWTVAQTIDLVEFINKQSILARSFLNPNSAEAASKGSYQQKLCLQILQRTEWMEWMRREEWVILGEKGLRPTTKWGPENPVKERLEWLQLKHITLCTRLHNHTIVATMGKNSAERKIWEEYKKKGGYEWYFTYHRLWLTNSPAAAHLRGAAPHPLAEAASSSTSLRQRVGAGAVISGPSNGDSPGKEDEEGDIVYVEARPTTGGMTAPKVEAKPTLASRIGTPAQGPRATSAGLGKKSSSGSISTTSTKVESSPSGPAPISRPAVQPPPVIPAKRSRSPSSKPSETKPAVITNSVPPAATAAKPVAAASSTSAGPGKPAVPSTSRTPPPPASKRARKSSSEATHAASRPSVVQPKAARGEVIVIDDSDEDDDMGGNDRQMTPPAPVTSVQKAEPPAVTHSESKPPTPAASSSRPPVLGTPVTLISDVKQKQESDLITEQEREAGAFSRFNVGWVSPAGTKRRKPDSSGSTLGVSRAKTQTTSPLVQPAASPAAPAPAAESLPQRAPPALIANKSPPPPPSSCSSAHQPPRPAPRATAGPSTSPSPSSSTSASIPHPLPKSRRKRTLPSSSPDIPTPPLDPADLDAIIQPRKHARDYALRQRAPPSLPPSARANPARSARTSNPTRDPSSDEDNSSESEVDSDHAPDKYTGISLDPPGTRLGFMMSPDLPSAPVLVFGSGSGGDEEQEEPPRDYGPPLEIGELVQSRPITPPLPEYVDVPFAMEEDVVMADQADEERSEEALEDLLQTRTRSTTPPSPIFRPPTPPTHAPTPPPGTPPLPDPPALPLSQDRPKLSGVLVPAPDNAPAPAPAPAPAAKSMTFDLDAMLKKSRAERPPSPPPEPMVLEREVYTSDGLLEDEDAFLAALSGVIGMTS